MIKSADCLKKYGRAELEKHMVLWDVPSRLELGVIPKRLYCNSDMIQPLTKAFENIINRNLVGQLKTWDGCFNIRKKRGSTSTSLHSWGVAVDINAAWNRFGCQPTMSKELVACFKDAGFDWGGEWSPRYCDGMHFQISRKTLGLE
jgi:hypothetical protein